MRRLLSISGVLIASALGALSVASPRQTTHLMQNDFAVVAVSDSTLVAAGPTALYTAVFEQATRQFKPVALDDYAGPATRIKYQRAFVIVESAAGSLTFLDALALPRITVLGTVTPPDDFYDFAVEESQLLLACGFAGVRQYDISGFSSLQFVDSSLAPVHAIAIHSGNGRWHVVDDYSGLFLFRPTVAGLGDPVSFLPVATPAQSIAVRHDSLFIGTKGRGIFLIGNTADSLVFLDTLPGILWSRRLDIADSLLLSITADGSQAELVSLSGHHNPLVADASELFGGGATFVCEGTTSFVTPTKAGGMNLYDLDRLESDLLQPRPANPYGGTISGIALVDGGVVVSRNAEATLEFESAGDPPSLIAQSVLAGLGGIDQVETAAGQLWLYSHSKQTVAVAATANSAYELQSILGPFPDDITGIRLTQSLSDTLNLFCLFGDATVEIKTVNPSWQIRPLARLYLPEQPVDIAVTDTLIVVGSAQHIYVYSINRYLDITYRSTIALEEWAAGIGPLVRIITDSQYPSSLWAVRSDGIQQFSLTVPGAPAQSGLLEAYAGITDAAKEGDYLYAASADAGVLRIFAPVGTDPLITDSAQLIGARMAVSGSRVALASTNGVWLIDWDSPTIVEPDNPELRPGQFALAQNYPNPFNPQTVIEYSLTKSSPVNLTVYNLLGQPVRRLVDARMSAGVHRVTVDGTGLASGVYVYRLATDDGCQSKKMVLVK